LVAQAVSPACRDFLTASFGAVIRFLASYATRVLLLEVYKRKSHLKVWQIVASRSWEKGNGDTASSKYPGPGGNAHVSPSEDWREPHRDLTSGS